MINKLLRRLSRLGLVMSVPILITAEAQARQDEPLFGQLSQQFKRPYLSFGALLQTVGDFQFDRTFTGNNGFSIANFRLSLSGELDQGFGYFLQTNFAASPAILDAYLTYQASPTVRLQVGQFKAPFSAEFLTSAASIDFVNRSQAVTALAPGRQLGAQVEVASPDRRLGAQLGVVNGNGTSPNGNDSDDLLYALRLFAAPALGGATNGAVELGINLAHSEDQSAPVGGGLITAFTGSRTLVGFDVRATIGRELVSAEVIVANLNPTVGADRDPWGLHATFGHMFTNKIQGLLRWDRFDRDNFAGSRDLIIAGFNAWPTSATEFQINYLIDIDAAAVDEHQLLANFQFNF